MAGRERHVFGRVMQLEMPAERAVCTLTAELERSGFTVLARFEQHALAGGHEDAAWLCFWHTELGSEAVRICPDAAVLGMGTAVVRTAPDSGQTHVRLPDPAVLLMLSDCPAMNTVVEELTRLIDQALVSMLVTDITS